MTTRIAVADVVGRVNFLRTAFGGIGEIPDGRPAEIVIGDSLVMVGPIVWAKVVEEPRDTRAETAGQWCATPSATCTRSLTA